MAGRGAAHHDALTSRCLAFAEGVATMVSPVLLALALKKDKWKSDVHEPALPMAMLTAVAGATLFTGICPTLACCASERFPATCVRLPSVTRGLTATVSSACLLFIACWISHLSVVSDNFVFVVGFLSGTFLLVRAVSYWLPQQDQQQQLPKLNHPEEEGEDQKAKAKELCAMVDKSHEFLSGVTGILFLALEGMALEGLAMASSATPAYNPGTDHQHAVLLRPHMSISFLVCAVGVLLIFLEMVPPRGAAKVLGVMYCADAAMAAGTGALLTAVVSTAMGKRKTKAGFLFLFFPFLIFIQLVYRVTINARNSINGRRTPGELHAAENPVEEEAGGEEEAKPAPMGLTKVTFTGFLVVSVKAISGGAPSDWTLCFLLFAAAAIVSGVSWRLLTHAQNKVKVGKAAADEAANVAAFCTHLCVAVATVLFAVVAWEAAAAGIDDEQQHVSAAACAHVSQVTCVHLDKILDVQNVRNMCTCIDPCRN